MLSPNFEPPYYAVIFTTIVSENNEGYSEMAQKMEHLAKQQQGFLGIDSARKEIGITVSYWRNLQDIVNWKNNVEHIAAQKLGREQWYEQYQLRISKVEREYGFLKS